MVVTRNKIDDHVHARKLLCMSTHSDMSSSDCEKTIPKLENLKNRYETELDKTDSKTACYRLLRVQLNEILEKLEELQEKCPQIKRRRLG